MSGTGGPSRERFTVLSYWRTIIILGLLGLAAGFVWGISDQPVYRATATVAVESDSQGSDEARLQRFAQRGGSQQVATVAAGLLGGDVAGADLLSEVAVTPLPSGGALAVTADAESPDIAAAAASGFAEALVEVEGDPLELGAAPSISSAPFEDRPAGRAAAIGLAAGAAIGLVLAFLLLLIRGRGGDPIAVVASRTDAPWMGTLDDPGGTFASPDPGTITLTPSTFEAYLGITRGIGIDAGTEIRSIAVAALDEDASSTCLGLAAAIAVSGRRALVVDAHPAGGGTAEMLGVDAAPGLSEFLAGDASPGEVLRTIRVQVEGGDGKPGMSTFSLLPGGRGGGGIAPGSGFAQLADRFARIYDLVIYLTPPVGAGRQSAAIGGLTDGTVLIAGRMSVAEGLARIPSTVPILGVVNTRG